MDTRTTIDARIASIKELEIRQVVESYPETMRVFDHYGMDMCCGGAHKVEEAARLHGLDPEAVLTQVVDAIQAKRS